MRFTLFILTGLLFSPLFSVAQKETSIITFGIVQNAFLRNTQEVKYKSLIKDRVSINMAAGILIRKELKNRLYFNYGLYYSLHTRRYKVAYLYSSGINENTNLSYLKLPLLVQYNIINKPNYKLFTTIGPQLCFLIVEDGALPHYLIAYDTSNTPYMTVFDQKETGGGYKPFIVEGALSIGSELKLTKKIHLAFHLRIDRSFHNVEKKSYQFIRYEDSYDLYNTFSDPRQVTRTMTIGALTGIVYKIR